MVKKLRIHRDEDLVKTFSGKTGILPGIFAVAITPDGKLGIAGSELHNIILWDLNTGYVLQTLVGHSGSISALCISPNGEKAISGSSDHSCIVWDLLTGQPIRTLIGHEKEIRLVWMSIDQKFAISWSHSDNTVIHWDLIRGSALKKIKLHSDPGWANAITSDGKMGIYATQNKRFNFCDLFSGKINQVLCWENSQNWTVAMTPDGSKAISGGQDETCILWNLNNYPSDDKLKEENNVFESLKFTYTPNGKIVLFTSPSNTCSVWDTQFNKEIHSLKGHSGHINYISVSPNGDQALTASSDNLCIYWDLFSGEPIFELRGHQKEVDIIVFTPDGNRAFSGSRDGNCIFWNLKSSKAIHVFKGHSSSVDKIVITSDGKNAISASYGMLIVWDLTLFNQILTFKGHQSTIVSISITPDNKFVISEDMDNNCIVWELKSGEVRYQLNSQKPHAIEKSFDLDKGNVFVNHQISKSKQFIRIDPGGYKAISVIRDKVLVVWNLQSGTVIQTFNDYNDYVQSVNISPNGKLALIAYAKGMSSFVYELNGLKKIAGYFPKNRSINSKFTSNGILTIYEHFGKRVISNMRLNILSSSFLITTIRQIWDFELKDYLPLLFDCPSCSSRFKPPDLIIETIGLIANSANLITVQSPCIALPLEVWEDPGLLSICPKCGQKLKFNPFIVYDFEAEEKKKKAAEEERKYTEILENAEHAFNEADWDKAFILFLNLIQAEKFDVSYHRFKMALCRINSLDVYKPEIIANIEVLKHLLQEAGEFERVQQINDKLIERLEAIKKAKKPWWRKIKEYSKLILPKFIRSSIAITFLVSSYLLLKNSLWFLFLSIPFFIIGLMLILITHIKKINVIYSNYIKKKLNIEYVQCPKCKKMHAVNKEESKFICQKCHCEFIINQ
jgi:WD40 repeat protein